jgi:hypothetical protein
MWRNLLGAQSSRDRAATCLRTTEAVSLRGSLLSHAVGCEKCVPIALTKDWTIGFQILGTQFKVQVISPFARFQHPRQNAYCLTKPPASRIWSNHSHTRLSSSLTTASDRADQPWRRKRHSPSRPLALVADMLRCSFQGDTRQDVRGNPAAWRKLFDSMIRGKNRARQLHSL